VLCEWCKRATPFEPLFCHLSTQCNECQLFLCVLCSENHEELDWCCDCLDDKLVLEQMDQTEESGTSVIKSDKTSWWGSWYAYEDVCRMADTLSVCRSLVLWLGWLAHIFHCTFWGGDTVNRTVVWRRSESVGSWWHQRYFATCFATCFFDVYGLNGSSIDSITCRVFALPILVLPWGFVLHRAATKNFIWELLIGSNF
jgi:hypothetical protein